MLMQSAMSSNKISNIEIRIKYVEKLKLSEKTQNTKKIYYTINTLNLENIKIIVKFIFEATSIKLNFFGFLKILLIINLNM